MHKTLKTVQDAKHFYGVLLHFRQFPLNFVSFTTLFAWLLRGRQHDIKWRWKHQTIIKKILEKLVEHTGLHLPNLKCPFVLKCE